MPAAFNCQLGKYDASTALEKLGRLISEAYASGFATHYSKQTEAWQRGLDLLGEVAHQLCEILPTSQEWWLFFEFEIPRRGRRPDVVMIADDLIFVIELKIGAASFQSADVWQVLSYALDLRDCHRGSHERRIIPMLIATSAATSSEESPTEPPCGVVFPVVRIGGTNREAIAARIVQLHQQLHDVSAPAIAPHEWETSAYRPTPSIIEAAERLYAGHGVTDISHSFAKNLDVTSSALLRAIRSSEKFKRRTILFVTGIPGAGKTLTGLNAVHDPSTREGGRPAAVFLSGNGPLVKIVREALVRDRQRGGVRRHDASRTVATFIDNVHRFISCYALQQPNEPPYENAVVFDEAQRAWDAAAVFKKHGICKSEPQLILEIMERAPNWCAVVALVGGGQEIHRGEAGLEEWGRALNERPMPWRVVASPEVLARGASVAGHQLFEKDPQESLHFVEAPELHLDVSVRSPRARRIGEWVNALVTNQSREPNIEGDASSEFPVVVTRDLSEARNWLRQRSDGQQRCGLLASSGAIRLRAEGIEVSSGFRRAYPYEEWFLSGPEDTRSSMRLEVAATEFECQGLELDWAGVCWGGDFVIGAERGNWICRRFRGTKWQAVRGHGEQRYLANKYRVLLTRARCGIVIWIPRGSPDDVTRDPRLFDATADFLRKQGVAAI